MNKISIKLSLVLFLFATLFFSHEYTAHAAFNFVQQSVYGDGKAYTTTSAPIYEQHSLDWGGTFGDPQIGPNLDSNPLQACNNAIAASGLSDAVDTYCVYERDHFNSNYIGGTFMCIPGFGCAGPLTFARNGDLRFVYIYQAAPTLTTTASLVSRANTWYSTWVWPSGYMNDHAFSWGYYNSLAPVWRDPPYPPDPAYPAPPVPSDVDVCGGVNRNALLPVYSDATGQGISYDRGWNMINPFFTAFYETPKIPDLDLLFTRTLDDRTCTVFRHAGIPAIPVATLSAAPASIISGGTSLLTWSCSNSSTSAVIDNGVGTVTPTSAGSISVSPTVTTTYRVTCTNAGGSANATANVTVLPAPSDLTATTGGPTTATAGVSQIYSGTVSNVGVSTTGAGFNTLLQVCDSGCSGYNNTSTVVTGALAGGASVGVSKSDTIPSTGIYYYRFCADNNTSWVGAITESNETNNCGAWSSIDVGSGAGAIASCTVSDPTPSIGSPVTYTATLSGSASAPFAWTPSLPAVCSPSTSSTKVCTFLANGNYSMQVSANNASITSCEDVTVGCVLGAPPTIQADPNRVKIGDTATLTWTPASGVTTSCIVSGPGVNMVYPSAGCVVTPAPIVTPPITRQSTYTVTCDGTMSAQVVVNIIPKIIEI